MNPKDAFIVVQHQNGFDYFFAPYCNSPGVMTVVCGNHSDDTLSLHFATELAKIVCYHFIFFSVTSFTFFVTVFQFSFKTKTQSILWTVLSILARQGELQLTIHMSDPVSTEVLPASEQ
jgi:hypothetical protein